MNLINTTINGYLFTSFIDTGGFGSVYIAEKEGVRYAVKIFREEYVLKEFRNKGENNRIYREIQILKSVDHPYLIKYIDDFTWVDQGLTSVFLVMEYAEGHTLRKIIDQMGPLPEAKALRIFFKLMEGIKYLHNIKGDSDDAGIIHRDLHPKNIIVDKYENVKIIDYGLSKIIDYTSITQTGAIMGLPPYMSPEQITDSKHIDKRSDLYTLGLILYEMLTGKLAYSFDNFPELLDKVKHHPPMPPRVFMPQINNHVENAILRLLEKQPYQRYQRIEELEQALLREKTVESEKKYDLTPKYYALLWNEKSIIEDYLRLRPNQIFYAVTPAHHQFGQKWMFDNAKTSLFYKIVDPSTLRLAYGSYTDVKGLTKLPYAPDSFQVISPGQLRDYKEQKSYVQKVIEEQIRLGADVLLSPFHYVHNTNIPPGHQRNPVAEWFDLDMKLLKESIDLRNTNNPGKELYAGICISAQVLNDIESKQSFLNQYVAYDCDGYYILADGLEKTTPTATLFNYIDTIRKLQHYSGRPVIAGRINVGLGLVLISLGLSAFSMGVSRFESFSEDMYKETQEPYNLYERYFFPQLLTTVSVERKNPTKLSAINDVIGNCQCQACHGKAVFEVIKNHNAKLHFLLLLNNEINHIRSISSLRERLDYMLERIQIAEATFKMLKGVFTPQDFNYLYNWREIINEFRKE